MNIINLYYVNNNGLGPSMQAYISINSSWETVYF